MKKMPVPVLKEKIRHILSRGILQGLISPSPTLTGRAASAAQGAIYGGIRSKAITEDNIRKLEKMTGKDVFQNAMKMSALGAVLGGLGTSASGGDALEGGAKHGILLGGTEAAVNGLRLLARK